MRRQARRHVRALRKNVPTSSRYAELRARIRALMETTLATLGASSCEAGELRVARLFLPSGEERHVLDGTRIIAGEGVEVAGMLIVESARPGSASRGIVVEASEGDVVLTGAVLHRTAAVPASSTRPALRTATAPASGYPLDAADVEFIAQRGNVIIGPAFVGTTGGGLDAAGTTLASAAGVVTGARGGRGGDFRLAAPAGTVRFDPRPGLLRPRFCLGAGGDGESIVVASTGLVVTGTALRVVGGPGGAAGRLVIEALRIQGIPTAAEVVVRDVVECSEGGWGGSVAWSNDGGTDRYRLDSISFEGGRGGDGSTRGGPGGNVVYLGGRVINDIGDPVTRVEVVGGDGGNITLASSVPVALAVAGGGGSARATGNDGWDGGVAPGGTAHADGADGGAVSAQGGDGGNVGSTLDFVPLGEGGAGGKTVAARSGNGGRVMSECDSFEPGGNGGASGALSAKGGAGGEGSLRGGDGGDVDAAEVGRPGEGGDGNPAGECGVQAVAFVAPGAGGGGDTPGDGGLVVALVTNECAGSAMECAPPTTSTTLPPPPSCDSPADFEYSASYSHTDEDGTLTVEEAGGPVLCEDGISICSWRYVAEITNKNGNVVMVEGGDTSSLRLPYAGNSVRCDQERRVLWPDGTHYASTYTGYQVVDDQCVSKPYEETRQCRNCLCPMGLWTTSPSEFVCCFVPAIGCADDRFDLHRTSCPP